MDKYKLVEKRLRDIYLDEGYLNHLKRSLEILEYEYGAKAINYDSIGSSGDISDNTGNLATRLADKRTEIKIDILKVEHRIQYLHETIGRLTHDEAEIIKMYYLKNYPIYKISSELNASAATIKRVKARAMKRLIRGLYGE